MTRQYFTLSVFIKNQMYPKITSKTCQTGDTNHDRYDIVDEPVKPVNNLLVRLK